MKSDESYIEVASPADPVRRRGKAWLRWLLVLTDASSVAVAWWVASYVRFGADPQGTYTSGRIRMLPLVVVVTLAVIWGNRLYRARVCSVRALETAALLRTALLAAILVPLAADQFAEFRRLDLKASRIIFAFVLIFLMLNAGRGIYRNVLNRARRSGRLLRPVVLVGVGDEGEELFQLIHEQPELGYEVRGVLGDAEEYDAKKIPVPYLGRPLDAVAAVRQVGATGVFLAPSSIGYREMNDLVRELVDEGIHVQISGGLTGYSSARLRHVPLGREAAFYVEAVNLTGWEAAIKRVFDIVLASVLILISAPAIIFFALAVKAQDRGPAFFRQRRVGRDGKPFMMLKIRTMVVDAEARLAALQAQNERKGPLFKLENDPRFTKLGRFLDATSINELPQFFNVLKGDMSLIGPRPALEREVAHFGERLLRRHRVRPGITGLWQVESRDTADFRAYERRDVFYVENWSVGLDIAILFQTAIVVFRRAMRIVTGKKVEKPAMAYPPTEPATVVSAMAVSMMAVAEGNVAAGSQLSNTSVIDAPAPNAAAPSRVA